MHKNRKPIFGVGINDHYQHVSVGGKMMKEYQIWTDMLRRCYSEFELNRHPTYKGCEASEGFKRFSSFLSWGKDQIGFCESGWQLDKDILFKGNKIYSEDTCCFVPPEINGLFVKNNRNRGLLPIGVKKESTGYSSTCKVNKKRQYLGRFDTVDDAFNSYKEAKEDNIKDVANKWISSIDNRVYEALMSYQVEITD